MEMNWNCKAMTAVVIVLRRRGRHLLVVLQPYLYLFYFKQRRPQTTATTPAPIHTRILFKQIMISVNNII